MQLVLGKEHLENERIYRKRMFAKSRIENEILENSRKPLALKSTRKRVDTDFERVSFVRTLARFNAEFTRQAVNCSIKSVWDQWRSNREGVH